MSLHKPNSPRGMCRVASSPAVAGHRPLALALALSACFASAPLLAQSTGAQAIHGGATLTHNGANLTVTTRNGAGTSHSAINWQSFNVPGGSTTHFAQPNAASTSINRVLGANPSAIFGTLSSNGKLVLVNPSGIAVGTGAVVDTAGFTASTLRMSDADALAGRLRFGQDGLGGGALAVQGQVVARGGDVVLIAPQVDTGAQAVVQAQGGDTLLVAGQKVELTGRGLEGIHLQLQAPADRALNLGTLKGDSVAVFASQLRHSGLVQAQSATLEGGKVLLRGQVSADVTGRATATRGDRGGAVHVTAAQTTLAPTAVLDASGPAGGGEVLVGGGWQGKGPLANAQNTTVLAGSTIRADATASGNGGTVVVWSDGTTRTAGRISARGGPQGGDGGRVETSGKTLVRRGTPDVGAPRGKAGTWLLDPDYILIRPGSPEEPVLGDGSILASDPGGVTEVFVNEISGFSGAVLLEANHAIVASTEGSFDLYANGDLTLRTINATEPPATPPAPFTNTTRGIDLSQISLLGVNNYDPETPRQLTIEAGTAATPVSGVSLRLNDVHTASSSYSGGLGGGAVTLRSAGDLWVGHIYTGHFGTVAGAGGNVTIEALKGHVRVGGINTTVWTDTYMATMEPNRAGDITVRGRTVHLTDNLIADGQSARSFGSGPGNITVESGLGCDASCVNAPTLMLGEQPMEASSALLPMTYYEGMPLRISARSGTQVGSGLPSHGGTIVLQALAGNVAVSGEQPVQIVASGRENTLDYNGSTASANGGTVRVKALAGRIEGGSLSVDVSGAAAAARSGYEVVDLRHGGHGGVAEIAADTGVDLTSLQITASGGEGAGIAASPVEDPAPQLGRGGDGGQITLKTASGDLLPNAGFTLLRAEGGNGGGTLSGAAQGDGTMGAGGNGGAIAVKAPRLAFYSGGSRVFNAAGGEGGTDSEGELPRGTGGAGGVIDLEASAADGKVYFGVAGHTVQALGRDPAQPYTGTVHLRAGSDGVVISGSSFLGAGSLHLDSPTAQPGTLGNVSITGAHDVREVYGSVANPSVSQGYSVGAGPARLTLETMAESLRLGGGSAQALTVAGDINITMRAAEGLSHGGTVVLADTVQSNHGVIKLNTNAFRLASGASHEKLVATDGERGAVHFRSDGVIRFSAQTHAGDPDADGVLTLNNDELARLDTPVLRVENYLYEAPGNASVLFGPGAAAPAPTTAAGPAPAPGDRVMFNGPGVLAPGKTVSIQTNMRVAQDEPFSVDRMHISAGAADLPLANLIGADAAGGRGYFSAYLTGYGYDLYDGGQARLDLRTASQATLELSPQDSGTGGFNSGAMGVYAVSTLLGGEGGPGVPPSVRILAQDDGGTPRGVIEIGQPGIESGRIELSARHIYNKGISGETAQGGVLRTVVPTGAGNAMAGGEDSILLDAAGDIGRNAPNGYLNVVPAVNETATRVHAHAGSDGALSGSQMALHFPQETAATLLTSMVDLQTLGAAGEVHVSSANAITVDTDFTPAAGVIGLYAGQRGNPEAPHDDGILTIGNSRLVGGLTTAEVTGTGTVKLHGASVHLDEFAWVQGQSRVEIEALGAGASTGNITLAPTAWVASGGTVAMHAQGSITGSSHLDSLGVQIEAPLVILGARKSVSAHVDTAELVAGDSPTNVTGGADMIDIVLTGSQATTIRGIGNADGGVHIWGPFSSLIQVSGNLVPELENYGVPNTGGVVGKSVYIDSGGDLHIGHRVKATDAGGSGMELHAGNVLKIGHFENYTDDVHVVSQGNIHASAQSLYLYHTAGTPTGTPRATPPAPDLPSVYLRAEGTLLATAYSAETFEVNATNTGGVGTSAAGGMTINSPTIKFVGGNGPNQFALATSPATSFSTTPQYTPGTGVNSFAASGAATPVFAPLPPTSCPAPGPSPCPPPPPAPVPTPPPPPAVPVPPPPAPPPAPTPPAPPAPTPPAPPPPAPPAPPAPAPTPAAAPAVERIVEVLRNDTSVTRAEVQAIVNEVDNTVTKFVALLIKEDAKQAEDRRKEEEKKETIAVIDGQQCKQ